MPYISIGVGVVVAVIILLSWTAYGDELVVEAEIVGLGLFGVGTLVVGDARVFDKVDVADGTCDFRFGCLFLLC